jgi:hypothetical protein
MPWMPNTAPSRWHPYRQLCRRTRAARAWSLSCMLCFPKDWHRLHLLRPQVGVCSLGAGLIASLNHTPLRALQCALSVRYGLQHNASVPRHSGELSGGHCAALPWSRQACLPGQGHARPGAGGATSPKSRACCLLNRQQGSRGMGRLLC